MNFNISGGRHRYAAAMSTQPFSVKKFFITLFEFIWHCLTMIREGFEPSIYRIDWVEFWYSGHADSTLVKYQWGDWVLDWNYNTHHEIAFNYFHQLNPLTGEWEFVWCPDGKIPEPVLDYYDNIEF